MHSYEARIFQLAMRAHGRSILTNKKQVTVEQYFNHDRCITGAMKALGYPYRDTLAAWIDELHPAARIHVVGKAPGVQRSPELKQAAV